MQMVVPTFLEHSMKTFADQQARMREQMTRAFGETPLTKNLQMPIQMMEEQVRRNTDMFRQAMQMFSPFRWHQCHRRRCAIQRDAEEKCRSARHRLTERAIAQPSEPPG